MGWLPKHGAGLVTDESPVRSVFWGTQRNEKLRLTAKKLLATCLFGGSQLPHHPARGKVRWQVTGEKATEHDPASGSCSSNNSCCSFPNVLKPYLATAVLSKSLFRRHRGSQVSSPPYFPLNWALCSWKLLQWTWLSGPRRQAVVRAAKAHCPQGQDIGPVLQEATPCN